MNEITEERVREAIQKLQGIREATGDPQTTGLEDDFVHQQLAVDEELLRAVDLAGRAFEELSPEERELLKRPEDAARTEIQKSFMNFYPSEGINPYVPLAASGPWIVTCYGAVIHDSGGYGMLGLGHSPPPVEEALAQPHVMANVMTPNLSQKRFADLLKQEIGHRRGSCPFTHFACLNSGSESVTLSTRLADIHAKLQTDPGGPHEGWTVRRLALEGGFHGRTSEPARLSESTREAYEENLASFSVDQKVDFVPINDVAAMERAFAAADEAKTYYSAFFVEPVMGEGISGLALSREFYDAARAQCSRRGTLLIVDSIQAALRAQGCLSIIDYPGFESCEPPDMETYSKALNAGQFPLSVVALREHVAEIYVTGVYGNTMTTNPRALDVGCAVLESIDDELRENVRARGRELREKLEALGRELPGAIERVDGTGLLVCAELDPQRYRVTGDGGFEQWLRQHGIEMIHGGTNGLRFTPHLSITSEEVDLIVDTVRQGFEELA